MRVKIIDIIGAVLRYNKEQGNYPPEYNALIIGKNRVILTDNEAIHTIHNRWDNLSLTIGFIPIKDLIYNRPEREEELSFFVRDCIEKNYIKLLESIKKIGLNPDDFPRKLQ